MAVEGLTWIDYKGKKILYLNYADFAKDPATQKEKTLNLLKAAGEVFRSQPVGSVLGIGNFENFHFDMDVLNALKNDQTELKKYYKRSAIIGVKGLIKVAYNFVVGLTDKNTKIFDTLEEAKDWVVQE